MPESISTTEVSLTRQEKEKLLQQMYTLPHWIAVIRLFGYQRLPMDQARQEIKPIAEEHGKEPVVNACEVLVEISTQGKETFACLKAHIRRMAFQILGPEPTPGAVNPQVTAQEPAGRQAETKVPVSDAASSAPSRQPKVASPKLSGRKGRNKPAVPSAPPPPTATMRPSTDASVIMEQYRAAKEKHPDMLVIFRMGDFFEMFDDDARTAHKLLGLTLTTRDQSITMAGFPHHQLETYLHKLLKEGQRVALCEPVDESLARGPIRREVTRVVTPDTPAEDDASKVTKRQPTHDAPNAEGRAVRQPRHFVLKQFEAWLTETGLAFVAVEDVRRTTPAVKPYVGALDYIVLRGETKLLVTVRPHLQTKHLKAICELQNLFGSEYKPMRIWPTDGPDGWKWDEHIIDVSAVNAS